MASIPTVFVDFDGTLAKLERGWSGTLADVLAEAKVTPALDRDTIREKIMGLFPWDRPGEAHQAAWKDPQQWWMDLQTRLGAALIELGIEDKQAGDAVQKMRDRILDAGSYTLYSDTLPALEFAREQGWKLIVLSNNYPELAAVCHDLGLHDYFDMVLTSANLGFEKPSPRLFAAAQNLAGLPEEKWMVGDNPTADAAGPAALGFRTILVRSGKPGRDHGETLRDAFEMIKERI